MKKTLLFLFSLVLCLTACQNEDDVINDDTPKFTLKAIFENDNEADATRTTVGTDGYTRWEMGDRIDVYRKTSTIKKSVFDVSELHNDGKMATFAESILSSDDFLPDVHSHPFYFAGSPDTKFIPAAEVDFPYQVVCKVDATQKYDAEKMVAKDCNPAYAYETKAAFDSTNTFHFKNLFGLLRLKFVGDAKITKIDFISETDKPVCGNYKFCTDENMLWIYPVVEWSNGGNTVTLDCGSGVQLNPTTPTDFYIVLPPATYSNFTIMVYDPDSFLPKAYTSHNSHTITRSKIHTISTLTFNKKDL